MGQKWDRNITSDGICCAFSRTPYTCCKFIWINIPCTYKFSICSLDSTSWTPKQEVHISIVIHCWTKSIFFGENFYTRHVLARKLLQYTDNEVHMIGTVWFNLVDVISRPLVQKAMDLVDSRPCGSCYLVATKDSLENMEELKSIMLHSNKN